MVEVGIGRIAGHERVRVGLAEVGAFHIAPGGVAGTQVGYGTGPDVHVAGEIIERGVALAGVEIDGDRRGVGKEHRSSGYLRLSREGQQQQQQAGNASECLH